MYTHKHRCDANNGGGFPNWVGLYCNGTSYIHTYTHTHTHRCDANNGGGFPNWVGLYCDGTSCKEKTDFIFVTGTAQPQFVLDLWKNNPEGNQGKPHKRCGRALNDPQVCMYVCMCACMYLCLCVCVNVWKHDLEGKYVCMYVCVCVCICGKMTHRAIRESLIRDVEGL